jgi:DNA-binding response OmpR family regulator
MADRIALAIEPDTDTANQIRRLLEPKGFRVESIPNGDDAMEWGRDNKPAVIILSVEPRKVGYAISNKLRRSPSLREVPLVLISSEETLATFEQHKKLKSRADEYLLKPLQESVFVSKVAKLAGVDGGEEEVHELDADSDIVLSEDDEDVIVDGDEEERTLLMADAGGVVKDDTSQEPHDTGATPFEGEKFDPETQAAFAALEAGSGEGSSKSDDMVDLRNLWSDDDLPPNLGWEKGADTADDPDSYRTGETLGPEVIESAAVPAPIADEEVPPAPEEIEFGDVATDAAGAMVLAEGFVDERRVKEAEARNSELETRIHSLKTSARRCARRSRKRASVHPVGDLLEGARVPGLREIINKKEKDILDLRDALDAKDRQILDHKDKIRELDRARRDLEEASLGFERNLVAANERVAELGQDSQKSSEREKAFKARLDDAHEELRKAREEIDGLKKRMAQDDARARGENERLRADAEARLAEAEEAHRGEVAKLNDDHGQASASAEGARQAELSRIEGAHRVEVDTLQRRIAEEQAAAGERLSTELSKIRKEHEKAIAAAREEQAVQLASERQAYEALTEQKERDHRNEILAMRRRQEEELAGAEERRQRDIAEQEARRVAELEAAETRRRGELQARDEENHARVTDIERRHLTEKTELTEKHRAEYDQALGRAARAEGELAARVQEIEQAYRRLSGLEADLDAARVELGNRDVKLAQQRDRIAELEAKVADYEDQIVRAYQRIRADDKTTEKTRRALAVALALIDERATAPAAPTPRQQVADESTELKT